MELYPDHRTDGRYWQHYPVKKQFLLTLLSLVLLPPVIAWGQGSVYSAPVQTVYGHAIQGAAVAICNGQPNVTVSPFVACSGTTFATIYTSFSLSTPAANPLTTDALGTYFVYATPGSLLWAEIYGAGITTYAIPFVVPGISTTLLLKTNGTTNSSQTLLDLTQGSGITIANVAGVTTISASGTGISGSCVTSNALAKFTASTTLACSNAVDGGSTLQYTGGGATTTMGGGTFSTSTLGVNVTLRAPNNNAGDAAEVDIVAGSSGSATGGQVFARGATLAGAGGDVELLAGRKTGGSSNGNILLSAGLNAVNGVGAIYFNENGLLCSGVPNPPPVNVLTGTTVGATVYVPDAKGALDNQPQGSVMACSGSGGTEQYDGTNWRLISGTQAQPTTKDFAVTGCTPASSTDSQCTGTITISPAFADASYIPQLTANGNGGSVPNLVVTVNGALSAGSIPYAISCTFGCGTVNAPTIYVHAFHP
jgi:hypothetical protein